MLKHAGHSAGHPEGDRSIARCRDGVHDAESACWPARAGRRWQRGRTPRRSRRCDSRAVRTAYDLVTRAVGTARRAMHSCRQCDALCSSAAVSVQHISGGTWIARASDAESDLRHRCDAALYVAFRVGSLAGRRYGVASSFMMSAFITVRTVSHASQQERRAACRLQAHFTRSAPHCVRQGASRWRARRCTRRSSGRCAVCRRVADHQQHIVGR